MDARAFGDAVDIAAMHAEDHAVIQALRAGDEAAFVSLLARYHGTLVRMAMLYVGDRTAAEEVAQETWLGVLTGLDRFEGRSSLKTWIFRILTNCARTRGQRDRRSIPFSALMGERAETDEPSVDPSRFRPADDPVAPHHWSSAPRNWGDAPEERLLAGETRGEVQAAIAALPPSQRAVITMRDVVGMSAAEVCNVLAITESNQRVLLHRARSKVRQALETYLAAS